jgi:death-on-curing family protein
LKAHKIGIIVLVVTRIEKAWNQYFVILIPIKHHKVVVTTTETNSVPVHSIIKNHAMVDGNKRTSWFMLSSFLYINGYFIVMNADQGMEFTLGIATDKLTLAEAAEMIRKHMVEVG